MQRQIGRKWLWGKHQDGLGRAKMISRHDSHRYLWKEDNRSWWDDVNWSRFPFHHQQRVRKMDASSMRSFCSLNCLHCSMNCLLFTSCFARALLCARLMFDLIPSTCERGFWELIEYVDFMKFKPKVHSRVRPQAGKANRHQTGSKPAVNRQQTAS